MPIYLVIIIALVALWLASGPAVLIAAWLHTYKGARIDRRFFGIINQEWER